MEWTRVCGAGRDDFFQRLIARYESKCVDETNDCDYLSLCGYGSCVVVPGRVGYDALCAKVLNLCGDKQRRWLEDRIIKKSSECILTIDQVCKDGTVKWRVSTSGRQRRSNFCSVVFVFLVLLPSVFSGDECGTHAGFLRRVYDWHDRGIYAYARLLHGGLLCVGLCE